MGDHLYFAYGSNMDPARLTERISRTAEATIGRLSDYRLAFNKAAQLGGVYANIVASPGDLVWGVVYTCTDPELSELDKREGLPSGHYYRSVVNVTLADGSIVEALAYVACEAHVVAEGVPSPAYLRHIVHGAREHGIPEAYVADVVRLGGAPDAGNT